MANSWQMIHISPNLYWQRGGPLDLILSTVSGKILSSVIHYIDVMMTTMATQITSLVVVYWIVYSGANQRKPQSSASLAFVRGIHRRPVNSAHKGPVTRKMIPFDDVIVWYQNPLHIGQHIPWSVHSFAVRSFAVVRYLFTVDSLTLFWHTHGYCFTAKKKVYPVGKLDMKPMSIRILIWWRHQMETFSALLTLLCGEFTGHRWIIRTRASHPELWYFLWPSSE